MKRLEQARVPMSQVLPKRATWIQDKVTLFEPKDNMVTTAKGTVINYDVLLLAAGLHLYYDKVHTHTCTNMYKPIHSTRIYLHNAKIR